MLSSYELPFTQTVGVILVKYWKLPPQHCWKCSANSKNRQACSPLIILSFFTLNTLFFVTLEVRRPSRSHQNESTWSDFVLTRMFIFLIFGRTSTAPNILHVYYSVLQKEVWSCSFSNDAEHVSVTSTQLRELKYVFNSLLYIYSSFHKLPVHHENFYHHRSITISQ